MDIEAFTNFHNLSDALFRDSRRIRKASLTNAYNSNEIV